MHLLRTEHHQTPKATLDAAPVGRRRPPLALADHMPAAMDANVKRLPTAPRRKRLGSRVLLGCVAGLVCALGVESWHVLFGTNLHVIVPGLAYRCAQPTRADVEHMVHRYGIKTIINLRGCCSELDWYMEES